MSNNIDNTWHIVNMSAIGINREWTNNNWSMKYSSNIFGVSGNGWQLTKNNIAYFGLKTMDNPWGNVQFIWNPTYVSRTPSGTPVWSIKQFTNISLSGLSGIAISGEIPPPTPPCITLAKTSDTISGTVNTAINNYQISATVTEGATLGFNLKQGGGDGSTVEVSGAGTTYYNGTYTIVDPSATGISRVWRCNGHQIISVGEEGYNWWYICPVDGFAQAFYQSSEAGYENPWDVEWVLSFFGEEPVPTVTQGGGSGNSLPSGLILTNTGIISGIPLASSAISSVIEVTASGAQTKQFTAVFDIKAGGGGGGENTVIVTGAGSSDANGTYTLEDPQATGSNRVWRKDSQHYIIWEYGDWQMPVNGGMYYASGGPSTNPWDTSLTWYTAAAALTPVPTVTQGS